MKNIDMKKPKYILPLLVLPFILGIGFIVQDMFAGNNEQVGRVMQETDDINMEVPEANLEQRGNQSKFEALKGAFDKSSDFSSIQNIEKEESVSEVEDNAGSLYSNSEMRTIDSLNQVSTLKQKQVKEAQERYESEDFLKQNEDNSEKGKNGNPKSKMQEEMELFKAQMSYLDSINNPKPKKAPVKEVKDEEEENTLVVEKAASAAQQYFNSVGSEEENPLITAIVDESLKVVQGSRVRIRLLDDIKVNETIISKGTYLFGNVSKFGQQRVSISITSLMVNGKRMKVNLTVYDVDGMEGFYVPASEFRDMTKDIGGEMGSQSMSSESGADQSQIQAMTSNIINDVYSTSTKALGKSIKKNKAKFKYGSQVYLVNNAEKK